MNTPFLVIITCPLANEPRPEPEFYWSIFYDTELELVNDSLPSPQVFIENQTLILNDTIGFGENGTFNITCIVKNQYGNDTKNTLISLCGEKSHLCELVCDLYYLVCTIGPLECQDGVTNNCSQNCIRHLINETMNYEYECTCDLGYVPDRFGNCEGEYLLALAKICRDLLSNHDA